MKKILAIFSLITLSISYSGAQKWLWGRQGITGLKIAAELNSVVTDTTGSVYITGNFKTTLILGSDTLHSPVMSVYLAKYDRNGNFLWAKQFPLIGSKGTINIFPDITLDNFGHVYIASLFVGELVIGPDTLYCSGGGDDVFLAQFDLNGNAIWATQSTENGAILYAQTATDKAGNVYVTGSMQGSTYFGPYSLISGYSSDFFLAKYDTYGHIIWARQSHNNGNITNANYASSITTDASANIYITGSFYSEISFGNYTLKDSNTDIVLVKYDSSGNVVWATTAKTDSAVKNYKRSTYNYGNAVATDLSGNIYITGTYSGPGIQFGPFSLKCTYYNVFWAKYSPSGSVLWAKSAIATNNTNANSWWDGYSLVTDNSNYLYLIAGGGYNSNITFGTKTFNTSNSPNVLVKLDSNGDALCGTVIPNGGGSGAGCITVDPEGIYIYTGAMLEGGNSIFGNDTLQGDYYPPFVARWQNCCGKIGIKGNDSICPGFPTFLSVSGGFGTYTWNTGNTSSSIMISPTQSQKYSVTVNEGICISTDSITVNMKRVSTVTACCNTTISIGQSVALSSSKKGSYFWSPLTGLSCDTCPNPIATPAQTTTYTLTIINDSGCTVQSFITIDVACGDIFIPDVFSPNETHNDMLYVRGDCIESMDFLVFDRWGNKVFESQNINNGWNGNDNSQAMNTGTYVWYLKATMLDGKSIEKKGNVTLVR